MFESRGTKRIGIWLAFVILFTGMAPVWSADPDREKKTAPEQMPGETIIVTANKIAQDVQDVPITMTVFSGEDLAESGIGTVNELLMRVPNLFSSGILTGNIRMMSFRGKTTMSFTEANPLIIYVDGIPMDSYFNADPGLLDVERVEILRGSQSTLYGKSSMGGVINIITRKPDNEFRSRVSGGIGSFETGFAAADVSGPIVRDKAFIGISARYDRTDGYMENPATDRGNDSNNKRAKVRLRVLPAEPLEINFQSEISAEKKGYDAAIKGPEATLQSPLNPSDFIDSLAVSTALNMTYDFGSLQAESITTHRYNDMFYSQDFSFLGIGVEATGRDVEDWELQQEIRVKSPETKDGFSWITGVYAATSERDRNDIWSQIPALFMVSHLPNSEKARDYAVFGQVTLPFRERFALTGAMRYQYTEKEIQYRYYTVMNGVTIPVLNTETDNSWDAFLPKVALTWNVTEDITSFVSVTRGFQPGGFNWSGGTENPGDYTFKAQTSWDYELGVKTRILNRAVTLNGSLFYSTIDDMQLVSYDPLTFSYHASNAAKATAWGAEADLEAKLSPEFRLGVSAAYTRAELDAYTGEDTGGTFDYSGNNVPFTPELTLGLNLTYTHIKGWFARAEVLRYGRLYWDEANSRNRDPITLLNARVGYETEKWGIFLWGNNLSDQIYLNYLQPASNFALVAPPRTIGLQFDIRF